MLLLIPSEMVLPGPTIDPTIGSLMNGLINDSYGKTLNNNYKFRVLPKPEGFPWPGALIDFVTDDEEHNELVMALHTSETDDVIPRAMIVLGFPTFRGAKLAIRRTITTADGTSAEGPEIWYAATKHRGLALAAWTLNKFYENPSSKPTFVN